jgi:hypothetical protein
MHNLGEFRGRGSFVQMHGTTKTSAWHLGRPSQEEIKAFWDKKLERQPATPRGVAVRPFYIRYEDGHRIVEDVYGPFLYENRRKPGVIWVCIGGVGDVTDDGYAAARWVTIKHKPKQSPVTRPSLLTEPVAQRQEAPSVTTYRRIHAAGFYLNRLCRRLPNEEPIEARPKIAVFPNGTIRKARRQWQSRGDGECFSRPLSWAQFNLFMRTGELPEVGSVKFTLPAYCRDYHRRTAPPPPTPTDPLLLAAKAEAERRFVEEGAKIYASNLPPISIQAHKAKAKTDVGDRFTTAALRKCNSKIRKAIRRVEKTKAYLHLFDKNEIERLRRLSFQKEVECLDRGLRGAFLKDNLTVPRGWAMHWVQGVYIPIKTPHGWVPKRALPTLDEIEGGNKRDWARLARDLRDPLFQDNKLLVAEVREGRHHKLIEVLIRRRVKGRLRLGDHRLMPGQFRGQSGIMELRNRKNDYS